MTEYIQIHWTCANLEEARQVAHLLLEKRLVACAQIIPHIESLFLWNNKIETQKEIQVLFKTKKGHFGQIKKIILEQAQYEVPEILATPILDGNGSYLAWLSECVERNAL